jgi:ABC-type polysaccharide/polyol phosphate transport system ATPase subunit
MKYASNLNVVRLLSIYGGRVADDDELGDFFDQPLKTYSLGMQTRLMFAATTAIRPDILIVDEVLGAGDATSSPNQRIE